MMTDPAETIYKVITTLTAENLLLNQADFIKDQENHAQPARRWFALTRSEIAKLDHLPRRCPLAEEDAHRAYEIRRLLHHKHHVLFTIDEATKTVFIIGFRHGSQMPRPEELHESLDQILRDVTS
jgi:plasmid stabilization system protein ParE